MNTAKNTNFIKKCLKYKLLRTKFLTKNPVDAHVQQHPPPPLRLTCLKYYNEMKWESRFTLGLNAAKNTDYIKKHFKEKLLKMKFPTKNHEDAQGLSPPGVEHFSKVIMED